MPKADSLPGRGPMSRGRLLVVVLLGVVAALLVGLGVVTGLRPAEAQTTSLLGTAVPGEAAFDDPAAVTLGVSFTVRRAGTVTAVRFYKGVGNDGTHVGGVFDERGATLGTTTFTSETSTGWQTAKLSKPVTAAAGQTLTVAVLMPEGHYAVDQRFDWPEPTTDLAAITGSYHYGDSLTYPNRTYLDSNYWIDLTFQPNDIAGAPAATTQAPAPTATVAPAPATNSPVATSQPTTAQPTTAQPTRAATCPGEPNTPGGEDPWGGCWPGPHNTGYPHGVPGDTRAPVTLTPYTGPTTIRSCGVVIDAKVVTGDLIIQAGNGSKSKDTPCVTVRNSLVKGVIYSEEGGFGPTVVTDTEVFPQGLSYWENIGRTNMFVTRVNSHGSEGVIKCEQNCEAVDSWVHGMRLGGSYHYNAFGGNGMSSGAFLIRHNWASCGDWGSKESSMTGDAGCSAAIGFYGDFDPVRNITIERNFLIGSSNEGNAISTDRDRQAGYCLNPGYYPGKPNPRPTNVKVVDNVFGRGDSGKCGVFGPTNSLNKEGDPAGNVWQGNRYEDGTVIARPEE
jgi:hypothetical protein